MARIKYDGVVEAVRYDENGQIAWVRAFLRRGPIFSDCVLVNRSDLAAALKTGKRFVGGKRLPYLAGVFEVQEALMLIHTNGQEIIVCGDKSSQKDCLSCIPVV